MLLIISPFLTIVVVLVWLATVSIDILAAGRAYVEGESLWSKNQKEAVFYLLRFAETGSESDFQNYQKAMKVPLGFRKARLELEKPDPNYALVREDFLEGGTHPDDIPGVIHLYERFKHVSYMMSVLAIWRTGDAFLARLGNAADQLHALYSSGAASPEAREEILSRIIQINEELRPWQNRFSTTLGDATRWIRSTLLVVLLAVAGALIPVGVVLTQRMVSRIDRAERELKELKLRQEYAAKLAYHASHDPLTNLLNRLEFENRLRLALQTASTQGRQHVVMFMDLDQFKIVNDTCGHAAGDRLLRQVSTLLKQQVREGDSLARLGGDEFGVLLENCPMQDAIRIADELRQCIADFRFVNDDRSFSIGASIGVVQVADGMLNLTEVLSAADAACYMAKEKGRNRVQYFRPHDSEVSVRRGEMEWASRLQRALQAGQFVLYAQPIISVSGEFPRENHYELLVRMVDDHGRIILPMAFIPAAERYSLMAAIDQWVIQRALATIKSLGANCGTYAINVSGTSIADERFLEFVREQFRHCLMPPRTICFEITETAAIANFDKAARFLGEMKSLGCLFSLDDFGAGMSSFGYLKHLPVDFIKIDGSFVKNVAYDQVDRATVQAINDVGHVMGKKTIGEFVDGELGLAALREIGVDFAQGDWIAPPAPFVGQPVVPVRGGVAPSINASVRS
ncbi:MAG TPA: EAL domain-containing protein [Burkholderiales bacterium]|nr:EAL domain-containing protein [Burkholderiales bacterium]